MKPLAALCIGAVLSAAAAAQEAPAIASGRGEPLYMKVALDKKLRLSSLKPGDSAEGDLTRDVYSSDGRLFTAGSRVRLTVDHLERRHKPSDNRWPWVVKVFMPRHENFPAFGSAAVSSADGVQNLSQVSLISAGPEIAIQARRKKDKNHKDEDASLEAPVIPVSASVRGRAGAEMRPVMSLEVYAGVRESSGAGVGDERPPAAPMVTLPAGTTCRVLLLDGLMSSKNRAGDVLKARLLEPIFSDSHVVLPAGSVFEGKITKAVRPRWLSRAGSLSLSFTGVSLTDGTRLPISASLVGLQLNRGSHMKMDAEGRLHGDRPGAAWMLINGGMSAGIAKEVDDGTQLLIEALLSTATDASTAGTARIAGTVVSGAFMVTRHGRDVILPRMTEMNIVLNRPLELGQLSTANMENAQGGMASRRLLPLEH